MAKLLAHCTHGKDDPERATLAFVVANVAATADQETALLLTIDGVGTPTRSTRSTTRSSPRSTATRSSRRTRRWTRSSAA